jgi:hypothetical protein
VLGAGGGLSVIISTPPLIPRLFLVHQEDREFFIEIDQNHEIILDFQYCEICRKWLRTGSAVQNGERYSLRTLEAIADHKIGGKCQ